MFRGANWSDRSQPEARKRAHSSYRSGAGFYGSPRRNPTRRHLTRLQWDLCCKSRSLSGLGQPTASLCFDSWQTGLTLTQPTRLPRRPLHSLNRPLLSRTICQPSASNASRLVTATNPAPNLHAYVQAGTAELASPRTSAAQRIKSHRQSVSLLPSSTSL